MKRLILSILAITLAAPLFAQQVQDQDEEQPERARPRQTVTLPPNTHVLLVLKNAISSKTARPGDAVYLQTSFPVVQDGRVAIPAGTYVQGVIDSAKRSGRIKGRAEIQMHFTRLVYPNGYMVSMASNVGAQDSNDSQRVEDKEGTVKAEGTKGRDAATIATTTGTGTLIGGLSRGAQGAGIGAGIGAGVGILTTMLTRGNEVRFEPGSTVDMVLQRPIDIDMTRVASDPSQIPPPTQRVITDEPQAQRQSTVPVLVPR
jgi:type IV secretion system protein VirB10